MHESVKTEVDAILLELQGLGTEHMKKVCLRQGAREPFFGVPTRAMKPLFHRVKRNHELAMALYDTGNYDAMVFAGMIADPHVMTETDFEHWMHGAYCYGLSDYVAAVSLAETDYAQRVADRWIQSEKELYASAGWSCYMWLLGVKPDDEFDPAKLERMLGWVERDVHSAPCRTRYAMNGFVVAVGMSYRPLLEQALRTAEKIGTVEAARQNPKEKLPSAYASIHKAMQAGRVGFKRRKVRC